MEERKTPQPEPADVEDEGLRESWALLNDVERQERFRGLPRQQADELFLALSAREQADLLLALDPPERRIWMRALAPDDAADVLQEVEEEGSRASLLSLLDDVTRKEVTALLAYAEDDAGGLMSPRFARVRPDMTVDEAIAYLRRQSREKVEILNYAYVLGPGQKLLGVASLRELFQARPGTTVREVMESDLVAVPEEMDQEAVSLLFREHDLFALPVVDAEGCMKGIVTVDDIVDVVEEEATEDIHKVGGMEALGAPYFESSFFQMVRKRGGWLTVLFVGEMLTASAMLAFEKEIARAVMLAVFLPLIISSGGNSGSQAATLVIRAMALGEVRLRDWWRVMARELSAGLSMGTALGFIGLLRVILWQQMFHVYGEHYVLLGVTVGLSLVGVVLLGTLSGSMLPFVLRRVGFDPASASAPFVATIVDVTGVVIYFTVAAVILQGSLL